MSHSAISCSVDYTFISFEMVACYGSHKFTLQCKVLTSISRVFTRSRYRGSLYSMLGTISKFSSQQNCDKLPSLGIAPKGSTDMSHCLPFDHSNGEPN